MKTCRLLFFFWIFLQSFAGSLSKHFECDIAMTTNQGAARMNGWKMEEHGRLASSPVVFHLSSTHPSCSLQRIASIYGTRREIRQSLQQRFNLKECELVKIVQKSAWIIYMLNTPWLSMSCVHLWCIVWECGGKNNYFPLSLPFSIFFSSNLKQPKHNEWAAARMMRANSWFYWEGEWELENISNHKSKLYAFFNGFKM